MDDPNSVVRITYRQPGTKPPLFVAGSFTAWEPQELSYVKKLSGSSEDAAPDAKEYDLEFFGEFKLEEGKYQYKFRVGLGDWWICDETVETVTDDAGNRNNALRVTASKSAAHATPIPQDIPDEESTHPPTSIPSLPRTPQDVTEVGTSASSSPRVAHALRLAHENPGDMALSENQGSDASLIGISRGSTALHSESLSNGSQPRPEKFPSDAQHVNEKMETTKSPVKEDEKPPKESQSSPIVSSKHGLATPPSSIEASPSLESLSEVDSATIPEAENKTLKDIAGVAPPNQNHLQTDETRESSRSEQLDACLEKSSGVSLKGFHNAGTLTCQPKDENLLEKVWRIVFVNSLRGLSASLCGRRRHEQLLLASAVVLVPAVSLYWRNK